MNIRIPSPAFPNGGNTIIACNGGETVSVSSLPTLTDMATDCFFHCEYQWAAPSGWVIDASGNPVFGGNTINLQAPSGLSRGFTGSVSVTAFYVNCGASRNTSSSTNIYYGTPDAINPYVNNAPAQSFNRVSNGYAFLQISSTANSANGWTWTIEGGSGSLSPSGNNCNVSTSNFARVVARPNNRCGSGDAYYFYIQNSNTSGYRVAPNPAGSNVSVTFEYPEITDAITSVTLYDEKGKAVKAFDTKEGKASKSLKASKSVEWDVHDLKKGTYFLHVAYGSVVEKLQVAIN